MYEGRAIPQKAQGQIPSLHPLALGPTLLYINFDTDILMSSPLESILWIDRLASRET
jgi:hypothetical protein